MRNIFKKFLAGTVILTLLTTVIISPFSTASALSKGKKALAAYSKVLTNKQTVIDHSGNREYLSQLWTSSDWSFATIDTNNDGTKELIITPDGGCHTSMYAYIDNRVEHLIDCKPYAIYCYPNKKIIRFCGVYTGYYYDNYYKFSGKELTQLCSKSGDSAEKTYLVKGKKVSKAKYNSYKAKLMKNAKKKSVKFIKNTSSARSKYLNG